MSRIIIILLMLIVQLSSQNLLNKVPTTLPSKSDYWIDYDNLENINYGMTKSQVEELVGEPNKLLSLSKIEADTVLVVEYDVRTKMIMNMPFKKPDSKSQNIKALWGDAYKLDFTYMNGVLVSIKAK